jgi:hypothetical protein
MTQRETGRTRELAWIEFSPSLAKNSLCVSKNAELDADLKIVQWFKNNYPKNLKKDVKALNLKIRL